MSKRKDDLKSFFSGGSNVPSPPPEERAIAGAVKAMGLSLMSGERIVEIDPVLVDPSPIGDRLEDDEAAFLNFIEDVKAHGQQVPALVRFHPEASGRYQVAYGHRRLRAAKTLGVPLRAVIRPLTDSELVISQGQENAQRRDLSYIERARFAAALRDAGHDRATLCSALAVQTAEITRLLALADAIPNALVFAIGPAPKAGRGRWTEIGEAITRGGDEAIYHAIAAIDPSHASDDRFSQALAALQKPSPREVSWIVPDVAKTSGRLIEIVDEEFRRFVEAQLAALHTEFLNRRKEGAGD
ncbi:MAG: plasmid partitioning protein RepB [Beijerinckiaceae bacterium]|jgi:ParB family chromosome partitioning protein|nr:plasmid partitioning protein RepB [Beijerinckiaceae bacterium]